MVLVVKKLNGIKTQFKESVQFEDNASQKEASNLSRKLSEIIKELEDKEAIKEYYFYREYYSEKTQLHLELNQNIADKVLKKNK